MALEEHMRKLTIDDPSESSSSPVDIGEISDAEPDRIPLMCPASEMHMDPTDADELRIDPDEEKRRIDDSIRRLTTTPDSLNINFLQKQYDRARLYDTVWCTNPHHPMYDRMTPNRKHQVKTIGAYLGKLKYVHDPQKMRKNKDKLVELFKEIKKFNDTKPGTSK